MIRVGDKKRIKYYSITPERWNFDGLMNEWMGKVVTISRILGDTFFLEEDQSQWFWASEDFEDVIEIKKFDNEDFDL